MPSGSRAVRQLALRQSRRLEITHRQTLTMMLTMSTLSSQSPAWIVASFAGSPLAAQRQGCHGKLGRGYPHAVRGASVRLTKNGPLVESPKKKQHIASLLDRFRCCTPRGQWRGDNSSCVVAGGEAMAARRAVSWCCIPPAIDEDAIA